MRLALRFLLSLSLANLLAIQLWIELISGGHRSQIDGPEYLGTLCAVLLGAMAIWASSLCDFLIPKAWRPRVSAAFLLACVGLLAWAVTKPFALSWWPYILGFSRGWSVVAALFALLAFAAPAIWRAELTIAATTSLLLVLSPFIAVTFGQIAWQAYRLSQSPASAAPLVVLAPQLAANDAHIRTVALIFDEFDYEIAFGDPTTAKTLQRFTSLRKEPGTLFATNAYPPMHSTMMSLPAMLTGRLVRESSFLKEPQGDILLTYADGTQQPLSEAPTLFSDLRAHGKRSLRMNEAVLSQMRVAGSGDADIVIRAAGQRSGGVGYHVRQKLAEWLSILPFYRSRLWDMHVLQWLGLPHPWERKDAIIDQMATLAATTDSDLLFLHILLPHKPVVFDRSRNGLGPLAGSAYRDNLLATDQALGRIVDAIRGAGRWSTTNLVVTTDHFYRNKRSEFALGDHRIPYIAHLAQDESAPVSIDIPFNTVAFRAMLESIVQGKVTNTAELTQLIQRNAAFGESPLTEYRKGW